MRFNPDIDKKSAEEINNLQGKLLRRTVEYVYTNSDYYGSVFNKAGITPEDIKGISDIGMLPITTKEDIQRNNWAFLCVDKDRIAEVVSTTGTTGDPIFFAMTKGDIERLTENEKRCFALTGVTDDDLFQIAVTLDNLFIAGMAYYRGLLKLGAGVIRIGAGSPKRQFELIRTLKPTGIVAVPSFILAIYREAEKEGIRIDELSLKKAVLIGETVRNTDFSSNTLGKMLKDSADIECYSTYGITEAAVAFCECPFHQGFHSHPDLVFAEILDAEGNQLKDGGTGELVLTTFNVEGMPLIRYRTGDMTFKVIERCNCGSMSPRIGPIVGRKAHKLKLKGTTVYPKTIENALLDVEGVENYVIEAYTGDDQADHVIVKVGSNDVSQSFKKVICENIRAKARVTPQVKVVSPEVVERIRHKGGRRKPLIFIDKR
ncbi:MAG: phenylacetate--CoA ligase family protein [Thermodesulfobacteriota bacterium]